MTWQPKGVYILSLFISVHYVYFLKERQMEFVAGQQNLPHLCSGDSLTSVHSIFNTFFLTRYHVNSIGYGVCFLLQKPGDLVLAEVLILDPVCAITLEPSLEKVLVQSIFMAFIYHFHPLKNCELGKTLILTAAQRHNQYSIYYFKYFLHFMNALC